MKFQNIIKFFLIIIFFTTLSFSNALASNLKENDFDIQNINLYEKFTFQFKGQTLTYNDIYQKRSEDIDLIDAVFQELKNIIYQLKQLQSED